MADDTPETSFELTSQTEGPFFSLTVRTLTPFSTDSTLAPSPSSSFLSFLLFFFLSFSFPLWRRVSLSAPFFGNFFPGERARFNVRSSSLSCHANLIQSLNDARTSCHFVSRRSFTPCLVSHGTVIRNTLRIKYSPTLLNVKIFQKLRTSIFSCGKLNRVKIIFSSFFFFISLRLETRD